MPARIKFAVFLVAFASLLTELLLMRVLDVILTPQLEYVIITCAIFSLGVAGVWRVLWPTPAGRELKSAAKAAIACGIFLVIIRPLFNLLPFSATDTLSGTSIEYTMLAAMYLAVFAIFFCVGLVFITLFTHYAPHIRTLYGWDLFGAACGCFGIIFLLELFGPGGLLLWAAACMFAAAFLLLAHSAVRSALVCAILLCINPTIWYYPAYFDFTPHIDKRAVLTSEQRGLIELTRWDPISKVDVIPSHFEDKQGVRRTNMHVALDGGTNSSYFYRFDGNFAALRDKIEKGEATLRESFATWGVLLSHYLKRDSKQEVLVIGAAGGQETKAALMYGAAHVDAIDLVGAIIDLGKHEYAEFIGNLYNDPRVNARRGEGRSFLQASHKKYDIIQIYSHSTSTTAAWGYGPLRAEYLMTTEAFTEYFRHLNANGILHINYLNYPRLISVAATAWERMGWKDFRKHVIVFSGANMPNSLPTVLIRMTPWKETDMRELKSFLARVHDTMILNEDPFDYKNPESIGENFFSLRLQKELSQKIPYAVPVTLDDRPYFNFLLPYFNYLPQYTDLIYTYTTWQLLLHRMKDSIPDDVMPIVQTGIITLACMGIFLAAPLLLTRSGRPMRHPGVVSYFACLGIGFVIIELCFIQLFFKLIGFPLYAYSTVIFTLLASAGLGSICSEKMRILPAQRWYWPFIGILVCGTALMLVYPALSTHFLASPMPMRIAVSMAMIAPLGFFLGMPFPLGLAAANSRGKEALAWAWAFNSSFTAVGGLSNTILSLTLGFKTTIFIALGFYALAFVLFPSVGKRTRTPV